MELDQKYVYEVYRAKSFSKAANDLFISQPSLSAMVKKLEGKLGFSIFDRTKTPLALTPQGEIYISYLEECFENEIIMKNRIKSLGDTTRQELTIGGKSFFSSLLYPMACGKISRILPNLDVKIDMGAMGTNHNIRDKVEAGILDTAIVYSFDPSKFEKIPILEERYYFTIHRDFPGADKLIPYSVSLEEILACKDFTTSPRQNYYIPSDFPLLRTASLPAMNLDNYIENFKFSNFVASNFLSGEMVYNFMLQGLGADISSDLIIAANWKKSADVLFIPIELPQGKRDALFIYKKGTKLSEQALTFVNIALEICADKRKFYKMVGQY